MTSTARTVKVLLVIQALLIGVIVGLLAGILAEAIGGVLAQAFISGAVGFGATVPLVMAIQKAIMS